MVKINTVSSFFEKKKIMVKINTVSSFFFKFSSPPCLSHNDSAPTVLGEEVVVDGSILVAGDGEEP
jgi:hypothetical protein